MLCCAVVPCLRCARLGLARIWQNFSRRLQAWPTSPRVAPAPGGQALQGSAHHLRKGSSRPWSRPAPVLCTPKTQPFKHCVAATTSTDRVQVPSSVCLVSPHPTDQPLKAQASSCSTALVFDALYGSPAASTATSPCRRSQLRRAQHNRAWAAQLFSSQPVTL